MPKVSHKPYCVSSILLPFQVPYVLSPLFSTLTKTAGVGGAFFPFWNSSSFSFTQNDRAKWRAAPSPLPFLCRAASRTPPAASWRATAARRDSTVSREDEFWRVAKSPAQKLGQRALARPFP